MGELSFPTTWLCFSEYFSLIFFKEVVEEKSVGSGLEKPSLKFSATLANCMSVGKLPNQCEPPLFTCYTGSTLLACFPAALGLRFLWFPPAGTALWLRCTGFSLWGLLCRARALGRTDLVAVAPTSQSAGSIVAAHELGCPTACGIFPDQGLNLCPLHWQPDSYPSEHQGSPHGCFKR